MAALATDNGKLAVMHWECVWEASLPMSPGTLGSDDRQQLLHGIPEVLWGAASAVTAFWCAMTGMSGLSGGGELGEMGGY